MHERRRAGLDDLRFHDLRHTWASWHVQAGTPLPVLQQLGGWASYQMVLRYAHLGRDHIAAYADNLGTLRHKHGTALQISHNEKRTPKRPFSFKPGGVVPRYRKPPCLIGEDTVGEIIYDAEVRVDFGCLRAFPTVDSLHCHDQRPGFLTFRWRHE
jgi:hypothetical protein